MPDTVTAAVRLLVRCLVALAVVAALASCSTAPGSASTDRSASEVANAISFPRQSSAEGLVRAAIATSADSRIFRVVAAEDIAPDKLGDPIARLVFWIHQDGSTDEFFPTDPVTACYEALFSYYGLIGPPHRVHCPSGTRAIVPPPLPAKPNVVIPEGYDETLATLLSGLPAAPAAGDVRDRITRNLSAPVVDPATGLRNLAPTVDTAVNGPDVGVSLWEGPGEGCLLGARVDGRVTVWRPARIQLEPGELSCDSQTALHLQGTTAPH